MITMLYSCTTSSSLPSRAHAISHRAIPRHHWIDWSGLVISKLWFFFSRGSQNLQNFVFLADFFWKFDEFWTILNKLWPNSKKEKTEIFRRDVYGGSESTKFCSEISITVTDRDRHSSAHWISVSNKLPFSIETQLRLLRQPAGHSCCWDQLVAWFVVDGVQMAWHVGRVVHTALLHLFPRSLMYVSEEVWLNHQLGRLKPSPATPAPRAYRCWSLHLALLRPSTARTKSQQMNYVLKTNTCISPTP